MIIFRYAHRLSRAGSALAPLAKVQSNQTRPIIKQDAAGFRSSFFDCKSKNVTHRWRKSPIIQRFNRMTVRRQAALIKKPRWCASCSAQHMYVLCAAMHTHTPSPSRYSPRMTTLLSFINGDSRVLPGTHESRRSPPYKCKNIPAAAVKIKHVILWRTCPPSSACVSRRSSPLLPAERYSVDRAEEAAAPC